MILKKSVEMQLRFLKRPNNVQPDSTAHGTERTTIIFEQRATEHTNAEICCEIAHFPDVTVPEKSGYDSCDRN